MMKFFDVFVRSVVATVLNDDAVQELNLPPQLSELLLGPEAKLSRCALRVTIYKFYWVPGVTNTKL